MITIYIDGASSGNPGKVGIGYCIYEDSKLLKEKSIFLGIQSNNFAEYMALVFSLIETLGLGHKSARVFSDSQLLCEQMAGNYKVKNNNIYPLFILSKHLMAQFETITISHIDRENNKEADKLAKEATGFLI